jgi:hypothetical protein
MAAKAMVPVDAFPWHSPLSAFPLTHARPQSNKGGPRVALVVIAVRGDQSIR